MCVVAMKDMEAGTELHVDYGAEKMSLAEFFTSYGFLAAETEEEAAQGGIYLGSRAEDDACRLHFWGKTAENSEFLRKWVQQDPSKPHYLEGQKHPVQMQWLRFLAKICKVRSYVQLMLQKMATDKKFAEAHPERQALMKRLAQILTDENITPPIDVADDEDFEL